MPLIFSLLPFLKEKCKVKNHHAATFQLSNKFTDFHDFSTNVMTLEPTANSAYYCKLSVIVSNINLSCELQTLARCFQIRQHLPYLKQNIIEGQAHRITPTTVPPPPLLLPFSVLSLFFLFLLLYFFICSPFFLVSIPS